MSPAHLASPPASPPPDLRRRTSAYLRLCGLAPREADGLAEHPVDEILARLDDWAAAVVLPQADEGPTQHRARSRAQVLLARAPGRWPDRFLHLPPPPDLGEAVRVAALPSSRPLRQTSMTPQPIDLGPVSDVAHETWKTFDKWPVLRGLTLWLLFCLLLAAVFYVVRF